MHWAQKNSGWGSVFGFSSQTVKWEVTTTYTHPALADNTDGNYQVRLADTTNAVTLSKAAKLQGSVSLASGASVSLVYQASWKIDADATQSAIFAAVVTSIEPTLTYAEVNIKYYETNVLPGGTLGEMKKYVPLEGEKGTLTYPSISAGTQTISR